MTRQGLRLHSTRTPRKVAKMPVGKGNSLQDVRKKKVKRGGKR